MKTVRKDLSSEDIQAKSSKLSTSWNKSVAKAKLAYLSVFRVQEVKPSSSY